MTLPPACLIAVVLVGAVLSLLGLAIVSRLAREPDERRVFGGGATAGTEADR